MSEPELIRNSAPHSVSVSQGSKVAGGNKSAEHSVRNTLAGEDPAPVKQEAPEITLSPRIKPAAAPVPHVPPPVAPTAKEEGESTPLPAAFHSSDEPQAAVLLERRSIQDDIQTLQGDVPPMAESADQELVAVPESLAQPEHDAAAPVIERTQAEHRINVPESLAADEQPAPEAIVVERAEQDHHASLPEPLPELDREDAPDAPVLTHSQQDDFAELPQVLAAPAGEAAEDPIISRASSDSVVELPPEQAALDAIAEGLVISRHEDDHLVAVPIGEVTATAPVTGPEISHAQKDILVAVPKAAAAKPAEEGPLITRSEQDNRGAVPEAEPRPVFDPEMPPPASGRGELDVAQAVSAAPEEALAEIVEIVEQAAPAGVAEVAVVAAPVPVPAAQLSPQAMAQMDFPARVVKLKIANDKVRVQLDALEAPERPRR